MNAYEKIVNTETGCHVELDRVQLQRDLVDRIIEGLDMNDLAMIVAEYLDGNYNSYTDKQLVTEVKDFYPDMLEDDDVE